MRVAVFSARPHDHEFLDPALRDAGYDAHLYEARLSPDTAPLAEGAETVCAFVNDDLGHEVLQRLSDGGTRLIALRCSGFNQVDMETAERLGIAVGRVPAYSPHAVAEHALALILSLNRKTHRAFNRVREGNFRLDGLLGFDLHGKTMGVIGTGTIGLCVARIAKGFGCRVVATDPYPCSEAIEMGVIYLDLADLLGEADIVVLQCPLTPETHHLIDADAIAAMKPGAMLINTSRGAVVDTRALIDGLKSGQIGAVGLDVYEEEGGLFFENLSNRFIPDDVFARLLTFPNVLITGHQGFFTAEAIADIASTTILNIETFVTEGAPRHAVPKG